MKTKVRIISYQNAKNYGAVLQSYGLQEVIRMLGYNDVKFINYNPKYLSDRYNPWTKKYLGFKWTNLRKFLGYILNLPFYLFSIIIRNHNFSKSVKRLLHQTPVVLFDLKECDPIVCDTLICGSDQIWNTAITGEFDKSYFGEGNYMKLGKRIAYAPSTELSSLNDFNLKQIAELLDNFDALSVRENKLRDVLQPVIKKQIEVCVDPTILAGTKIFEKIANKKILFNKKYIIVYSYNVIEPYVFDLVKQIPSSDEYEVHYLSFLGVGRRLMLNPKVHSTVCVEDFLGYFYNASYVVTNSFHGLAFSLLFKKNFNVGYVSGKSERCYSLLESIGMLNRLVKDGNSADWSTPDYEYIDSKLAYIRQNSLEFLKNSLK